MNVTSEGPVASFTIGRNNLVTFYDKSGKPLIWRMRTRTRSRRLLRVMAKRSLGTLVINAVITTVRPVEYIEFKTVIVKPSEGL